MSETISNSKLAKKPRLELAENEAANVASNELEKQKETASVKFVTLSNADSDSVGTISTNSSSAEDDDDDDNMRNQKRQFEKIPIYIVEYHNDVLNFIFDCVRTRFLPSAGNTLIHYDSHPDMVIPRELKSELAYDKTSLLNECSIESWIMPLCYTGIIKRIVWIKQPCCQQIPIGQHKFHIGSYNNKIYVDFAIPYFLSEASLCETAQLKHARSIELLVVNDEAEQKLSTLNWFAKPNETYILDIDLDFFCTKNPFLNLYTKCANYYEDLALIFDLDEVALNMENITAVNERRLKMLDTLKRIFEYLKENAENLTNWYNNNALCVELDAHKLNLLKNLIQKLLSHYKPDEIDWLQIYDAGCTADSGGLPDFAATSEDLAAASQRFRNTIMSLPHDPVFVTISRSSEDEFCPSALVEEIQAMTIRELGSKLTLQNPIRGDKYEKYNLLKMRKSCS